MQIVDVKVLQKCSGFMRWIDSQINRQIISDRYMDKGIGRQIGTWNDGMARDRGWND